MNLRKWGEPQTVDLLVPGVASVSSASHGGIVLSPEMNAKVPEAARAEDGCYEEDAAWAIAWCALRKDKTIPDEYVSHGWDAFRMDVRAQRLVHDYLPEHALILTGMEAGADSLKVKENVAYEEARSKVYAIAISARGAGSSKAVPDGMVGAIMAPVHPTRNGPDREKQFFALIPAPTYDGESKSRDLHCFHREQFAKIDFDPFQPPEITLTAAEAYEIASSWGSYMTASDPGQVFYTFPVDDARPQSPEHRLDLIRYTNNCIAIAKERGEGQEVTQLLALQTFFARAEQAPEPEADFSAAM